MNRATLEVNYYPNTHVRTRNSGTLASEYYLTQDLARKIRYDDIKALRELANRMKR